MTAHTPDKASLHGPITVTVYEDRFDELEKEGHPEVDMFYRLAKEEGCTSHGFDHRLKAHWLRVLPNTPAEKMLKAFLANGHAKKLSWGHGGM